MRAKWSTPARKQLAEIIDYIAVDDPLAALKLDEEINRTVQRLERFPYSARIGRVAGTREALVGSYFIIYEVRNNSIEIDQILHCAQQYP